MKKLGVARKTLSFYWYHLKKYPVSLTVSVLFAPIAIVSQGIIPPLIYANIIDDLTALGDPSQFKFEGQFVSYVWQLAAVHSVGILAWRTVGYINTNVVYKTTKDIEDTLFSHLSRLSYTFFTNTFSGALVAQMKRFVSAFEQLSFLFWYEIITFITRFTAIIIVLAIEAPEVAVIFFAWAVMFIALAAWLQRKKSPITKARARADTKVTSRFADVVTNIFNVKTFSNREYESLTWQERTQDKYIKSRRSSWFNEHIFGIQSIAIVLVEVLVLWIGLNLVFSGSIGLGIFVLIQFYVGRILYQLFFIGRVIQRGEQAFSDAYEMTQILQLSPEVKDPVAPRKLNVPAGKVEFSKVTFQYNDTSEKTKLFKNLSLIVSPGEKVGLVGPSGGGKSTLTKILLRFIDVEGGHIMIDGHDIKKVTQDDLRSAITYVPQEPILFHRSIKDNIRYSQPQSSQSDVEKVANMARAADFIKELPDKYETLVGERGVKLSGGEKQRIAIARAMLKDSPIVVLDEATSSLDSSSEKLIIEALDELMKGRTTIVIAHRLSTIQKMDRIIVMDKGKIVEEGSHEELLKKNGLYAKLWKHQSGGFLEE